MPVIKNKFISPGQACEILKVDGKALSGIVKRHKIECHKNPIGKGMLYDHVQVITAALARKNKNAVPKDKPSKIEVQRKSLCHMKMHMAQEVSLLLIAPRALIRQVSKVLESDPRFDLVFAEYSDPIDKEFSESVRNQRKVRS